MLKALSDITFAYQKHFCYQKRFRYHFWMQKCKTGAFGWCDDEGDWQVDDEPPSRESLSRRKRIKDAVAQQTWSQAH